MGYREAAADLVWIGAIQHAADRRSEGHVIDNQHRAQTALRIEQLQNFGGSNRVVGNSLHTVKFSRKAQEVNRPRNKTLPAAWLWQTDCGGAKNGLRTKKKGSHQDSRCRPKRFNGELQRTAERAEKVKNLVLIIPKK